MSDDQNDVTPAPPVTTHDDSRELGYGAVDARPDLEGLGESEAAPGKVPDADSDPVGSSYTGGPITVDPDGDDDSPISTRDASHDRAA